MGIETAIIGSAVVGAAASASAAKSSSKAAKSATKSADAAAQLQYEASSEQLAFSKQQYDDWQSIYGPIQDNLSNYYKNLSSDTVASLGIQNIEKEYARSSQLLDQSLAKRGLSNSGATTQSITQLESARMLGRAEVQANAPMVSAQQQSAFLSAGLGAQSQALSGINSAFGNQINLLGQQAANSTSQANNYSNQAAAGYAGIGSSVGQGINTYMTYNAYQSQNALNNALANKIGNSTNYSTSPSSYGATSSWWQ